MPFASRQQIPRRSSSLIHCVVASLAFDCFRARPMRSVRSQLRVTEAACHSFGRTTGTNRPRSSRMMGGMARLLDPITQSRKFRDQLVLADQTTRHTRPYPPTRIGERRNFAVEDVELETLPS